MRGVSLEAKMMGYLKGRAKKKWGCKWVRRGGSGEWGVYCLGRGASEILRKDWIWYGFTLSKILKCYNFDLDRFEMPISGGR